MRQLEVCYSSDYYYDYYYYYQYYYNYYYILHTTYYILHTTYYYYYCGTTTHDGDEDYYHYALHRFQDFKSFAFVRLSGSVV